MWPTFQRASGTPAQLSFINISISNLRNSDLDFISRHIWREEEITGRGERPPRSPRDLNFPLVCLHTYLAAEKRCCTTNVDAKAKDNAGPLGQGQVCFYFRQRDDLFKASNLMTSTAFTRSQHLGEPTLRCFTHVRKLDRARARTCTSVGTVGLPPCVWHHRELGVQVDVCRSGRKTPLLTSLCQSAAS